MRILSEGQFRDFDGFEQMGIKPVIRVLFDRSHIDCTADHKFLRDAGQWIEAGDIKIGESYNNQKVLDIVYLDKEIAVYDAINVKDTHSFYAEGATVHNCNMLYIDETAFVENWGEFSASVLPTISSGTTTKILYTSTPNGLNHFHKTCVGAKEGRNGYQYVEVPWWEVPGRDEKWKEETLAAMDYDYEKFNQEYCCEFQGSSGTLLNANTLKSLVFQEPIKSNAGITVYDEPKPDHNYVIVADVAEGVGLDYSALQVIDVTQMPYNQVCVYRDNFVTPIEYSEILNRIGKIYNEASILIEINNGLGAQVADTLFMDFEYENILSTVNKGRNGKQISSGFGGGNIDKGIRTTKSVKAVGCSILKLLVEQQQLIINDFDTIQELSTFSRKGSSYEAESGKHDDLVMCLVLFSWLSDQRYFKEVTDINTISVLRNKSEDQMMEELTPFGIIDDGCDYNDSPFL